MNHDELFGRVRDLLPDPDSAAYFLHWGSDGKAWPTFISLLPQADGTVLATQGDMRERIIPVLDETGQRRVFPDEASACEWAWTEIQIARRPQRSYSQAELERWRLQGEEKARLRAERERQWLAERGG